MHILIAPDSFKGSLAAKEAAQIMAASVKDVFPEATVKLLPMADGGEGTVQALVDYKGGKMMEMEVEGPLGDPVKAHYGVLADKKTAVIEMASASGLTLIEQNRRDPLRTSTYGTGQLIKKALEDGCEKIFVGIGGSATNDGGAGMAEALGVRFLDEAGNQVPKGGGALSRISKIDHTGLALELSEVEIIVLCDVDNPLTGKEGASYMYGPQKGADSATVKELDKNLLHFGQMIRKWCKVDVDALPGAGAAGGLGAGLIAFAKGRLVPGVECMLEMVEFEKHLIFSDLVITGEGRLDRQTARGKVIAGIGKAAKKHQVPVVAFAGEIVKDGFEDYGLEAVFSIACGPIKRERLMAEAGNYLKSASLQALKTVRMGTKMRGI